MTISDTIVAGNTAAHGPDIAGPVTTDQGHNLIGGDPLLAPLGDNGRADPNHGRPLAR